MKYLAAKYIEFEAEDADAALKLALDNDWDLIEGDDYDPLEEIADQLEVILMLDSKPRTLN